MQHFMLDGLCGYRSRFDDIKMVQEILDETPRSLGLKPVMPAFLLPYYDGVSPDDSGISSFTFLQGGHFTLHTFSFRGAYFVDLLSPQPFSVDALTGILSDAFPCRQVHVGVTSRLDLETGFPRPDPSTDFGLHLLVEIEGYKGPDSMDELFSTFDRLPGFVGMTPIMRPYIVRSHTNGGGDCLSAMTMIAESHISLHLWTASKRAMFDIFSCKFFNLDPVEKVIRDTFPGQRISFGASSRGSKYQLFRRERNVTGERRQMWL